MTLDAQGFLSSPDSPLTDNVELADQTGDLVGILDPEKGTITTKNQIFKVLCSAGYKQSISVIITDRAGEQVTGWQAVT